MTPADGLTYPLDLNKPGAIEALLAYHRSIFGDARMEADDDEGGEEGADGTESQEDENADTDDSDDADDKSDDDADKDGEEVPPEVLRAKLTEANAQAANFRVKLREAQKALESAKTVEEYEAATTELNNKIADLEKTILRNNVAQSFSLPPDLAERLKGDTEEELKADAKKLAKFIPAGDPDNLEGGLTPGEGDDEFDPVKEARKARTRRY